VTWLPGCEAVALFLQITDGELPGAMRCQFSYAREMVGREGFEPSSDAAFETAAYAVLLTARGGE
jgi:hypothetical protein